MMHFKKTDCEDISQEINWQVITYFNGAGGVEHKVYA